MIGSRHDIYVTALLAVVVIQGPGCGRTRAPMNSRSPTPPKTQSVATPLHDRALIYLRRQSEGPNARDSFQAIWQRADSEEDARVLYETGCRSEDDIWEGPDGGPPTDFGILPSPDGRWLHVWESAHHTDDRAKAKTVWSVVEVLTGRQLTIGELPTDVVGYFPYWQAAQLLSLEKGDEATLFDVRTGQLTQPLPLPRHPPLSPAERDIDATHRPRTAEWRQDYVTRHYAQELKALDSALATFGRELGVSNYLREQEYPDLPDVPADMLMRPFGVLSWDGPGHSKLIWPSVAISPDLSLLARTAFVPTGRRRATDFRGNSYRGYTFDARIDVYALPSGRHLWGQSVPQRNPQARDVAYHFVHARLASVVDPWFKDPRWSSDGSYLAFATQHAPSQRETVSVLDTSSWQIVQQIEDATDAFIVPAPEPTKETGDSP